MHVAPPHGIGKRPKPFGPDYLAHPFEQNDQGLFRMLFLILIFMDRKFLHDDCVSKQMYAQLVNLLCEQIYE